MTMEKKQDNEDRVYLTERQFWVLAAILAIVIVLVTRKLITG